MNLERVYIVREGIRREDDRLPDRFLKEPLGEECGDSSGSVVELEPMLDEYYRAHEWSPDSGVPKKSKLKELGLDFIVKDLKERGILD